MKKVLALLGSFFAVLLVSSVALANPEEAASAAPMANSSLAFAAAAVMSIAAAMGTFSQSRAASAALEGIARNPQSRDPIFVPLILSLALMESLVILSFVIAFLLWLKM